MKAMMMMMMMMMMTTQMGQLHVTADLATTTTTLSA
jgi:hypothetical protein